MVNGGQQLAGIVSWGVLPLEVGRGVPTKPKLYDGYWGPTPERGVPWDYLQVIKYMTAMAYQLTDHSVFV